MTVGEVRHSKASLCRVQVKFGLMDESKVKGIIAQNNRDLLCQIRI